MNVPQPFSDNANYRAEIRAILSLHRLWLAGKGESPEADAVRDATDGHWELLSEVERKRIRGLSEDLNSITDPPPSERPTEMNPQAQAKLVEASDAIARCELDRALELLRRWASNMAPALLSFLRGRAWFVAGDPETAIVFYEHATRIDPNNPNFQTVLLECLKFADPGKAISKAEAIIRDPDTQSEAIVVQAAEILYYGSTRLESVTDYFATCNRIIPILEGALQRFEQNQSSDELAVFAAFVLLAACHRVRGDTQAALAYYARALQIQPSNAPLLVSRGILPYGTSPRAIADFEFAIQLGANFIWPYFFLSHFFVTSGCFDECRSMCERGLRKPGPLSAQSELWEWLAISQAELGYPADVVRASFENAIRSQPTNDRARNNLRIFEDSQNGPEKNHRNWERRSASILRSLEHEEFRTMNAPRERRELSNV